MLERLDRVSKKIADVERRRSRTYRIAVDGLLGIEALLVCGGVVRVLLCVAKVLRHDAGCLMEDS